MSTSSMASFDESPSMASTRLYMEVVVPTSMSQRDVRSLAGAIQDFMNEFACQRQLTRQDLAVK